MTSPVISFAGTVPSTGHQQKLHAISPEIILTQEVVDQNLASHREQPSMPVQLLTEPA